MAIKGRWEWRKFGAVSVNFVHRFCELEPAFPQSKPQRLEDVYFWDQGLKVNIKIRLDIPEEPLKFKRLQVTDGDLEKWSEDDEEIFDFPLIEAAWDALVDEFAKVDLTVGPYPSEEANREMTRVRLKKAGVKAVDVYKLRESRLWKAPHGLVKVERASISAPQVITSIGLETWDDDPEGEGLPDEQAKEDILAAIKALGLDTEPLRVMNYVDAVAVWASGDKI